MKYLGPDFQYDAELSPAPNKVKLKAKTMIQSITIVGCICLPMSQSHHHPNINIQSFECLILQLGPFLSPRTGNASNLLE